MGHFANGEWNSPCGVVYRDKVVNFGPTANGNGVNVIIAKPVAAEETARPTSYKTLRQGLYQANIYIVPSANNTNGSATFTGGVTYTNDAGTTVNIDLTTSPLWTTAIGGTAMLASKPFDVDASKTIQFYYNYTNNTGTQKNLTAYILLRAL